MPNKPFHSKLTLSVLLALIAISGVLYLVVQLNAGRTLRRPLDSSYQETGAYIIDPETVLQNLDQGNMEIFKPSTGIAESEGLPYSSVAIGLFPWDQSDYLKVAHALHQFVWKETLRDWHLYSMYFYRGCQDNPTGFDAAKITYFKATNGVFSYTTRVMDIYPIRNGVSWGGTADFPRPLSGWKSINLEKLKVTADSALQIAEQNGAREGRLQVDNMCTIDIVLSPNSDSGAFWRITYFSDLLPTGDSVIFKMQVDPNTGEYTILDK